MIRLHKDFLAFITLLNENQIEYLLIGGYAVNYYGYSRPTGDLDIWVNPTNENRDNIIHAVSKFNYNPSRLEQLDFTQPVAFHLGDPPFQIDILNIISGAQFQEAFQNKVVITVEGVLINVISLPDLKLNKFYSARHRDLDDLENLSQS